MEQWDSYNFDIPHESITNVQFELKIFYQLKILAIVIWEEVITIKNPLPVK